VRNYLISEDVAPFVHIGIASHNLFDHALAMLLSKQRGVEEYCSVEMLEGMSETAYRVLKKDGLDVILYAPIASRETFTNAIAYLVRRFDENTAEQNFLRHSFGLSVDSPAWQKLIESYNDSINVLPHISLEPFRTQNRNSEEIKSSEHNVEEYIFRNESDTDFALPQNIKWAESIAKRWKNISKDGGMGKSAIGSGKKVGGFNYISQFMNISLKDNSPQIEAKDKIAHSLEKVVNIKSDFGYWLETHFNKEHDYSHIRGESNIIRYIGVKSVLFRFSEDDALDEMLSSIAIAQMVGAKIYLSLPQNPQSEALNYIKEKHSSLINRDDTFALEDETALIKAMQTVERIRFLKPPDISIYEAVAPYALYIATEPFVEHGRIELMHYFIEQSISDSYHRYGNLGVRGLTKKGEE